MSNGLKVFFLIVIFMIIFSCKTVKDNNANNNVNVKNDPTKFIITDDTKEDELKKEIKALFTYLEDRIAKGDYEGWFNAISQKYKDYLSDPENLKIISEKSDFLFNRNFTLNDSRDYFKYVVILSREGKSLEFINYKLVDKNHIKVFCLFDKKDELIYDFIYEDGSWKVDR